MTAERETSKDHVSIYLHEMHLSLLDKLIPFYGGTRAEVIRFIVIDWLSERAERVRPKKRRARR